MTNPLMYGVLVFCIKMRNHEAKIEFLLLIVVLAFAGCGSDRNSKSHNDSLMTDSAVMDTTDMNAAPIDTTAMKIDTLGPDTGLARQKP